MSKNIKLKKGFDINLNGQADKKLAEGSQPDTFALKPSDFPGMQMPKLLIKEGDDVKAGSPIFYDKKNEQVLFTAPVSGEIAEVRRGAKRKILEIKILADKEVSYESFDQYTISDITNLTKEQVQEQMLKSGVWPQITQRPFGVIADHNESPKAIFISAFDSHPLAPDYDFIYKGNEKEFQAGLDVLKKFTSGTVHLNTNASGEVSSLFTSAKNVQLNKVSGPHPAGNVGVQIHHIDPINKGDIAWTVTPYGVIQIGKLFLEGKYDASTTIAVAGSEVKKPQYYRTYMGACINKFVEGNLNSENVRFISGNVLTGNKIEKEGYLGYFHNQLTVIPEGDYYEMFGWIKPTTNKLSFQRAFGLLANTKKKFTVDTNEHGEPRAFVQTGIFEKVMPMDILPTYLLKAILAEDFDEMEALGIYEIIEEDLALCEYIDVSKHNVQQIVREGLSLIQYS
jgi:Na+-transporting NADH:ubiquinone oxidoreductase subunit A